MNIYSILGTLIPVFMFRALADHYAKRNNNKALLFLYNVADDAPLDKCDALLLNHYYARMHASMERGLGK